MLFLSWLATILPTPYSVISKIENQSMALDESQKLASMDKVAKGQRSQMGVPGQSARLGKSRDEQLSLTAVKIQRPRLFGAKQPKITRTFT